MILESREAGRIQDLTASIQVPAQGIQVQAQNIESGVWRGRAVHESMADLCMKIKAVAAVVLSALGIAIAFANPGGIVLAIIDGIVLGTGIGLGIDAYKNWKGKWVGTNDLEEALKYLTGKNNLDDLPSMPWTLDPKTNHIKRFYKEDMPETVMALKEGNKTIAVAVKYFDSNHRSVLANKAEMIQIFSFHNKFLSFNDWSFDGQIDPSNGQRVDGKLNMFEVKASLNAHEGHVLEKLLRNTQ